MLSVFSCLCVERFELLGCQAFSAARVLSVSSCSCVGRFSVACLSRVFQLLVCQAFLVARASCVFSRSCGERFSIVNFGVISCVGCLFRSCLGRLGCS